VCRVFNFRPYAVVLRRRMQLAAVESMYNVASCTSMAEKENSQEEGPRNPYTLMIGQPWTVLNKNTGLILILS